MWAPVSLLLLLATATAAPRYSSRIVDTQSGGIRGVILEPATRHLEPVEAFLGVPYASAGRLRPPGPPPSWHGTRLADSFAPVCPQRYPDVSNRSAALARMPTGRFRHISRMVPLLSNQSEDCLHLNIYVPGSGNRGLEAPYAVLVFIHGDSYEWGSGNPYDGSVLASRGHVIVLTLNFRLGLLGFLKTRSGGVTGPNGGNLALKDIISALRWARTNLHSFGGDPSRIVLLGHGTGAALANLVLLSPEAKGSVHRVVLLSGSGLSPWAMVHDPDTKRSAVAEQLGCNVELEERKKKGDNDDDIADCLESRPLEALLDVRIEEAKFTARWGPHTEPGTSTPLRSMEVAGDSFITSDLLAGVVTAESYLDFSASEIQFGFEEDYRNRLLRTFVRNGYVYHLNEIYAAIRNEYTDWDKPIQHPINIRDSTMEALSDGHTAAPLLRVAHLHARRGAATYFFHFAYQTKDPDFPQRLGSVHGEQLTYALGLPLVDGEPYFPGNYSRQDMIVSEALLSLLVTFAKVGVPGGRPGDPAPPQYADYDRDNAQYKEIEWPPYDPTTRRYLAFGAKPKVRNHYRGHKMALWLNLIPQLHRPGSSDVLMRHHQFKERDPHFYAGPVRPESFALIYGENTAPAPEEKTTTASTECQPTKDDEDPPKTESPSLTGKEAELMQKLAGGHYYSYATALGVTVAVGCFLLLLNTLIFVGMYYQRRNQRIERAKVESPEPEPPAPVLRQVDFQNEETPKRSQKKRVQIQEISV